MKKVTLLFLVACIALPLCAQSKGKIAIPDLKGYITLKCDFHMHSIFSDGTVWPTVRVDEAYREGLDAISLTEHIESRRYPQELERLSSVSLKNVSHQISYEIALPYAKERDIMLVKGAEITRQMPPGHSNAIFIANADDLAKSDYIDAFRAAKAQNAFIFWNHPGWVAQQPDTTLWFNEHTQLLQQGMIHGIEVVNGPYYPEAHRWCLEKKLTMIGTSDAHAPLSPYAAGTHRTMTLVFARSRTPEAIHEALKERRTAIYYEEFIIGEEIYLKELFENALEITVTKADNTADITIRNKSDLTFHLKQAEHDPRLVYLRNVNIHPFTLLPQSTSTLTVRLNNGIAGGDVNFIVGNFLVEPDKGMKYTIKI